MNLQRTYVVKGITEPYLSGESFKFKGRVFRPSDVADFLIKMTPRRVSDIAVGFQQNFVYGTDVTDTLLKRSRKESRTRKSVALKKNVFIVHGRDHKPMKELKAMLKEFGLNPIVLHEQPSGSRIIVEKLEKYSDVGYAFVILTPDDVGAYERDFRTVKTTPGPHADFFHAGTFYSVMKYRARQNVVLEFGYFIGLLDRDRVCCLYKADVELPSDMHGIVYIPFKESVNEVRDKIVKELKAAGYKVKI